MIFKRSDRELFGNTNVLFDASKIKRPPKGGLGYFVRTGAVSSLLVFVTA